MPLKAPSVGIQLPKRQSQSIGLSVCIALSSPAVLPVKEASLIEERCLRFDRYSTELELSAVLLMKSTPATERDSLTNA